MVEIVKITLELALSHGTIGGNALMVFDIRPPLVKIVEMVEITSELARTPPGRNGGNALGTPSEDIPDISTISTIFTSGVAAASEMTSNIYRISTRKWWKSLQNWPLHFWCKLWQ